MFVVHTSNCHGQNCTRRAIYMLGIDTLIANILVFVYIVLYYCMLPLEVNKVVQIMPIAVERASK